MNCAETTCDFTIQKRIQQQIKNCETNIQPQLNSTVPVQTFTIFFGSNSI